MGSEAGAPQRVVLRRAGRYFLVPILGVSLTAQNPGARLRHTYRRRGGRPKAKSGRCKAFGGIVRGHPSNHPIFSKGPWTTLRAVLRGDLERADKVDRFGTLLFWRLTRCGTRKRTRKSRDRGAFPREPATPARRRTPLPALPA